MRGNNLHILLNYEWDSKALLSLVLVGLPELKDQLQHQLRRFRSLQSRIHCRLHVDPLTPEDTAEHLRYRMKRAGGDRDVFTQDAVQMLHEAAIGGMRDLDRLATGCLREAARWKRKLVERDLLARVLHQPGPALLQRCRAHFLSWARLHARRAGTVTRRRVAGRFHRPPPPASSVRRWSRVA